MDKQVVAIIFNEGGKFLTELLRLRVGKPKQVPYQETSTLSGEPQETPLEPPTTEAKAKSIEAGCLPCSLGHLGTCVGVLNEAMRFAGKDGIESGEVIDRINICMDELNALERVDLRPEMITALPEWEKDLANKALASSRSIRHSLAGLSNVDGLEEVAAKTQSTRQEIGREYFQERIARMTPEEKGRLRQKVEEVEVKNAAEKKAL